jgi:hypothetical protein
MIRQADVRNLLIQTNLVCMAPKVAGSKKFRDIGSANRLANTSVTGHYLLYIGGPDDLRLLSICFVKPNNHDGSRSKQNHR